MIEDKIKNLRQLKIITSGLKKKGKRIVFTNGCFDILHSGHVKYLQDARKKGDILIAAVNSDASVRRIKGKNRPIVNEKDRIYTLAALESVNYAVLFNQDTPIGVIKTLKPDIIAKGADWKEEGIAGSEFVKSYGGGVCRIKLLNGRSTTDLIKKIAKIF